MLRTILASIFVSVLASSALAKDLCVQSDTGGSELGGRIVLKKVKLGKGTFGPVNGYFAHFTSDPVFDYTRFFPVAGQSIVDSNGNLAVGLSLYEVNFDVGGNGATAHERTIPLNVACNAGADQKISELDTCSLVLNSEFSTGHVLACKEAAPPIP